MPHPTRAFPTAGSGDEDDQDLPMIRRTRRAPAPPRRMAAIFTTAVLGLGAISTAGCSNTDDGADSATTVAPTSSGNTPSGAETTTPPMLVPELFDATDTSFYATPEPVPAGNHGDLVRYQLTGNQPNGMTRYRVMYLSETRRGEPTVVTGLVAVPSGDGPSGGWPVLTYSRGSSGIADNCAISMAVDETQGSDPLLAAEAFLVEDAVSRLDMVATVTDYEGIGGPGIHPYLSGVSEARATLDIVRAAGQLPDLKLRSDVGIMGYSQGGHAALWANQHAAEWTPELVIHGTVSGAPASELAELLAPGGFFDDGSRSMLAAGMAQEDPSIDLADVLTPDGEQLVDLMSASCRPDPQAAESLAAKPLLQQSQAQNELWPAWISANTPGKDSAAAPVLIFHGDADESVPVEHSQALQDRLCASGVPTERRVIAGAGRVAGAVPTIAEGADWLAARIARTQPNPTC
ncbi:MAG: hypothetical protein IPG97_18840 [Microthrixaceae bacterium]|nr:hypothetical protein [Microthrixaceae bacterium]